MPEGFKPERLDALQKRALAAIERVVDADLGNGHAPSWNQCLVLAEMAKWAVKNGFPVGNDDLVDLEWVEME